jgi:hypothetical protein
MTGLRPIFFAIACCLTLVVPAQASAMMEGIGPKCRALQEKLVEMTDQGQMTGENESVIAVCIGLQAITPRGIDMPVAASAEIHSPSRHGRLAIAKRPAGIERPPRI